MNMEEKLLHTCFRACFFCEFLSFVTMFTLRLGCHERYTLKKSMPFKVKVVNYRFRMLVAFNTVFVNLFCSGSAVFNKGYVVFVSK